MKSVKRVFMAMAAMLAVSVAASAQFSIGPRVGINVNSMRFDSDVFDSDNRAGFTGGLQVEFMVPVVNLGFDASVMYVHRVSNAHIDGYSDIAIEEDNFKKKDYIEIPVNLKWKIGVPVVGNIVTPYIFTGPSFAFLTSRKAINEAYKNKALDVAWNFGFGVQLLSKLQLGASYGLGLTKVVEKVSDVQGVDIDGKNRYWTITAAWMF